MQCYVYRSEKRGDTYVYLRERDAFGLLPANLAASLGALSFVLEVALTPERKLARGDAAVVRANLAASGFHIQFPPSVDGEITH
ncbi:MAG: YcgL domain-containing protein [Rhodanobacteraceae bacterium]|nr:YcgL domain-containing protein [Rhodanobacteraceae bacterium]MBL0042803.1 YcgL domain-containing protein [Xanthomonadales bacterium]MBP6079449.1 YcgL domain-containing protein [Xanthomonadales bacterium]MBP7623520.1 YcgL domain-containing protein [Xanthomonadales bacterium]